MTDKNNLPATQVVVTSEVATSTDVGSALINLVNRIGPDSTTAMVEALEKMCELQIKMDAITAQKNFNRDRAALQSEIDTVPNSRQVTFKSKKLEGAMVSYGYVELHALNEYIKPLLRQHGFSLHYDNRMADQVFTATCILSHVDGHSESSSFSLPIRIVDGLMSPVQQIEAIHTVAMRRSLVSVLAIAWADKDTDGADPEDVEKINEAEIDALKELIKSVGFDSAGRARFMQWIKSRFNAESLKGIPKSAINEVVTQLQKKKAQGAK